LKVWFVGASGTDFNVGDNATITAIGTDNQSKTFQVDTRNDKVILTELNVTGSISVVENITADQIFAKLGWTNLTDYPVSCPVGSFVTQIDDSITCTVALTGNIFNQNLNTTSNVQFSNLTILNSGNITVTGDLFSPTIYDVSSQGLVLAMNFNNGSVTGNAVLDSSGKNNHGTNNGATHNATDGFDNLSSGAFDFDGVDDYIEIPDSNSLDITDAITIAAWIKVDTFGSFERIVDKNFNQWTFVLTDTSPFTGLEFWINNGVRATTSTGELTADTWHFVVATYDKDLGGTEEVKIYIDGVIITTGDFSTAILTNDDSVNIGRATGGGTLFDGTIDEVSVWNRALSSDEIKRLYLQRVEFHDSYVSQRDIFVNGSGSFGIGTVLPTNTFNVVGDFNLTGFLFIGSADGSGLSAGDLNMSGNLYVSGVLVNDFLYNQSLPYDAFNYNMTGLNTTWQYNQSIPYDSFNYNQSIPYDSFNYNFSLNIPNNALTLDIVNITNFNFNYNQTDTQFNYNMSLPYDDFNYNLTLGSGWQDTGTNVYLVTSTDSVGIGTDSPTHTLNVAGTLNVSGSAAKSTGGLHVNASGSVGIGTASPAVALDVVGAITASGDLQVNGGDIGTSSDTDLIGLGDKLLTINGDITIDLPGTSTTTLKLLGNTASQGSVQIVLSVDTDVKFGQLVFEDADADGTTVGGLLIDRLSSIITGAVQNDIVLFTNAGSSKKLHLATEDAVRLTVDSTGNVGIGTASPAGKFTIKQGSDNFLQGLTIVDSGSTDRWDLALSGNDLFFGFNSDTKVFFGDDGKVGIGDTTPTQLLDIDGTNPQLLLEESTIEFVRLGVEATAGDMVLGWDDSDDMHFGVFSSPTDTTVITRMIIESGGDVGIGTSIPAIDLAIGDSDTGFEQSADGVLEFFSNNVKVAGLESDQRFYVYQIDLGSGDDPVCRLDTGELTRGASGCTNSAIRYKQNIQDLKYGLKEIMQFRPVSYEYKTRPNRTRFGMIAEDVLPIIPEIIGYNPDNSTLIQNYDKRDVQGVMIKAIQEQQVQIEQIQSTFDAITFSNTESILDLKIENYLLKDRLTQIEDCTATSFTFIDYKTCIGV